MGEIKCESKYRRKWELFAEIEKLWKKKEKLWEDEGNGQGDVSEK